MSENHTIDDCVGIVTVNYRTPDLVVNGLAALQKEQQQVPNLNVVIVDNDSGDDSVAIIQKAVTDNAWSSWVKVVAAPKNGGYAYGNNLGFETLQSWLPKIDYYWMLNPDTEVLPGGTKALVDSLVLNPETIVGSCLQDRDGTKQTSTFNFPSVITEMCSSFSLGFLDRLFAKSIIRRDLPSTREATGWLAGASLMFTADVQSRLGGLDEEYFLYFEEVDYLLKANRMGVICWYVPESRVIHEVGASTGISDARKKQKRRPAYWFESRRRYFMKNHGRLYLALADAIWLLGYGSWYLRKSFTNKQDVDLHPPKLWLDFACQSQLNPVRWFKN